MPKTKPKRNHPFEHSAPRVRRNEPCPCGSGRKFKRCCMHVKPIVLVERTVELPDFVLEPPADEPTVEIPNEILLPPVPL